MRKNQEETLLDSNHKFRPHMAYVWVIFSLSLLPIIFAVIKSNDTLSGLVEKTPLFNHVETWYKSRVEKVEEMRTLAKFPDRWEGAWYALDKNYANFDRWFNDNMGLRDFFIRSKNELDFRLFSSSSRVYYGSDDYIFGRNLIDNELNATEYVMSSVSDQKAIIDGMVSFTNELKSKGITTYFVLPMQKEYFIDNKLPFFAPKLPHNSNFMNFYQHALQNKSLNVIDVFNLINTVPKEYRTFYTQDFHWNHLSAFKVSENVVNKISENEKSDARWDHKFEVEYTSFLGSDARFSSRLIAREHINEPTIKKTWKDTHVIKYLNAKETGLEFETDLVQNKNLLPETCMFGNSFSDGMLDVGIVDFFSKFTKLDRTRDVSEIPKLIDKRCKYLIVQILDIQSGAWSNFKKH